MHYYLLYRLCMFCLYVLAGRIYYTCLVSFLASVAPPGFGPQQAFVE